MGLLEALSLSDADVFRRVLRSNYIVEFGIIKEVLDDERVTVTTSATKDEIVILDCILANVASSSVAVKVKPNINDKVIVFFPKSFSNRMFSVEQTEPVISQGVSGYCVNGGIAVLLNQFNEESYKNIINVEDGKIEIKLAYDNDSETNNFNLTVDEKGSVNLSVGKDSKVSISVTSEGEITLDNGKASVSIDSSGNVNIETSGKYKFKNNSTDLKSVIDGLASELENLTTVGSPSAQATSPASKGTIATWRTTKLNSLLE